MLATDKTQQMVADEIGWSRDKVARYAVLENISPIAWKTIVTEFSNIVTDGHLNGVTKSVTVVTEGLLRNILSLTEYHQHKIISELVSGKIKPAQMSLIRGRRYNRLKKSVGASIGNANASKQIDQNDPIVSTAETLAKEHGVSPATIKRDGSYWLSVIPTPTIHPRTKQNRAGKVFYGLCLW